MGDATAADETGDPPAETTEEAPPEEQCPPEEEEEPDGLSHIECPLEVFEPVPYVFILRDLYGNQMRLPASEVSNAQISCPPFHTLLDHVLAVLWIVYSGERSQILRSSHVHWALKFLEGMKDKHNRYCPDVEMAIDQLSDLLVDMVDDIDEDTLKEPGPDFESTRIDNQIDPPPISSEYNAFAQDGLGGISSIEGDQCEEEEELDVNNLSKDLPSLLLNSMVVNDDCIRDNILKTMVEAEDMVDDPDEPEINTDTNRIINKATRWQEEKTNAAVAMLNHMKYLNDLVKSIQPEQYDPEKIKQIEDYIKDNS